MSNDFKYRVIEYRERAIDVREAMTHPEFHAYQDFVKSDISDNRPLAVAYSAWEGGRFVYEGSIALHSLEKARQNAAFSDLVPAAPELVTA